MNHFARSTNENQVPFMRFVPALLCSSYLCFEMSLLNNHHVFGKAARAKPRASFYFLTNITMNAYVNNCQEQRPVYGEGQATRGV